MRVVSNNTAARVSRVFSAIVLSLADTPGALFQEVIARRTDLDMQAKMREDPLYAIQWVDLYNGRAVVSSV